VSSVSISGPIDLTASGGFVIAPSKRNRSNSCNAVEQKRKCFLILKLCLKCSLCPKVEQIMATFSLNPGWQLRGKFAQVLMQRLKGYDKTKMDIMLIDNK